MHSLAEPKLADYRQTRRRSLAQIQCCLFQMASFCPPLTYGSTDLPRFLAISGSDLNAGALRTTAFAAPGTSCRSPASASWNLTHRPSCIIGSCGRFWESSKAESAS